MDSGVPDSEPIAVHLHALLEMLEPKLDRLRELASRCSMDVFCGFSSESGQGGFTLDPDLLIRLGEIPGGGLNLDLYPPTEPG